MAISNPLQIQNIIFTKSHVFAIPSHVVPETIERSEKGPKNTFNIEKMNDDNEFAVTMTCIFNPEQDPREPYSIDVMCIGIFKVVDETATPEQIFKALHITGHSIVFGAIRESVLYTTSRFVYGPFMLGLSILQPPKTNADTDNAE